MKLFKSKAEKEQERKMLVRQSMRELEKRIQKLEAQQKNYIADARKAREEGLPDMELLAKNALKMTVTERKRTYRMLLQARIISQMKDMNAMTNEFLKAVQVISKDIAASAGLDIAKITGDLKFAMDKVTMQTENLNDMLENSQDEVGEFSEDNSVISDEEIDKMIYGAQDGAGLYRAAGVGYHAVFHGPFLLYGYALRPPVHLYFCYLSGE